MKESKKKATAVGLSTIVSLFLFGCLGAQPQPSSSLLWKIEGNGLTAPSYLFGTIHVYDDNVFKIPKRIFKSIDSCSSFALEVDLEQVNQAMLAERIMITGDSTLDILLGEEAFEKLMNLPMMKLMGANYAKRIKPLFASSYMFIEDFSTPTLSVDQELYTYAKKEGKQIFGLETIDEQLDAVDAIPLEEQATMLKDALNKFTGAKDMLGKLMDAYKNQDFESLEKELDESTPSPLMKEELLDKRNLLMAERIDSLMQEGKQPLFTAVGALHLSDIKSIKGVTTLLKERGYTLTPVAIKFK